MEKAKFIAECLIGSACAILFDVVFIICTQMHVIISNQNIVYVILQLIVLSLAVVAIILLWQRKLGTGKQEVLYRTIIMVIYMANLLSLAETLHHTKIWHALQVTEKNRFLKIFIILYLVFLMLMWAIQMVKMLNLVKVDRVIESGLERLFWGD